MNNNRVIGGTMKFRIEKSRELICNKRLLNFCIFTN